MDAPKQYNPKESEQKWLKFWEEEKIYAFDPNSKKDVYSIDTPPPTVSGKMHIGHSFSYAQQDFIARFQRMRGNNVFYPFGTDDNGLATERMIEKMKNVNGQFMERKEFVKLCLKTLEEIRPDFVQDWKTLGVSADFSIFYTTINEHCQKISQKSFLDLYKDKRVYRKKAPVMWDPLLQTALSQVELVDREMDSTFNDIVFKAEDGKNVIIVTTRPELLSACVAVFVHPDDKRHKKLVGRKLKVPVYHYDVEVLADKRVDMEKGTGIVMCCTFGDQTDIEWYKAYKLPLREAIAKDGKMTKLAGKYEGMKINETRKAIIDDMKESGELVKQEHIKHTVNVGERSGAEIEIIESPQWFVKYLELKDEFIKYGRKIKWHPEFMISRYENWIKGLQWDWCISRQRHFGIPIPVWYCKKCDEPIPAEEKQLPVDPLINKPIKKCKCGSKEFVGEKDVLDTWATSALTPDIAIELFKNKKIYEKLFPMSLRPQAHDIITFWLFNTVVKSYFHHKKIPWDNIMISGWALDPSGKKMSKSKGNVVDPREVIERFSVDSLRFWAAGGKLGDDLPFQEKDLVTGKRFVTKIWNASRFAFIHLKVYDMEKPKEFHVLDKWMLSKLTGVIKDATEAFENYEYSKTKNEVDTLFWKIFCDNYLEIIKDRLYNNEKYEKEEIVSAKYALYHGLLAILKLMAPITPYITEELYQLYYRKNEGDKSIHISAWPELDFEDKKAEKIGEFFIEILSTVRKEKSMKKISLKTPVRMINIKGGISKKEFETVKKDLEPLVVCDNINYEKTEEKVEVSVMF